MDTIQTINLIASSSPIATSSDVGAIDFSYFFYGSAFLNSLTGAGGKFDPNYQYEAKTILDQSFNITGYEFTSIRKDVAPVLTEISIDVPFFLFLTIAIVLFAGLAIIFRRKKNAS